VDRSEIIAGQDTAPGWARRPVLASGLAVAVLCLLLIAFADRPAALWFEAHRGSEIIAAVKVFTDIGLGLWW
jgi:hypothetical protein